MAKAKIVIKDEMTAYFFIVKDGVEKKVEAWKTMGGYFCTRDHIPIDSKLVTDKNGVKVSFRKVKACVKLGSCTHGGKAQYIDTKVIKQIL